MTDDENNGGRDRGEEPVRFDPEEYSDDMPNPDAPPTGFDLADGMLFQGDDELEEQQDAEIARLRGISQERDHELPNGREQVGYKRPPKSGRITGGEVRNPYGRRGKPKPSLKGSGQLALMLADKLNQKIPVRKGGKVVRISVKEAVVERYIGDLLGPDPRIRKDCMKLLQQEGILNAEQAFRDYQAELRDEENRGWSPELERRFKIIEAEFFEIREVDEDTESDETFVEGRIVDGRDV